MISTCTTCGGSYLWDWDEAFDKFGFGDGDGQVETETVADVLRHAGYVVETTAWGLHNVVITSITRGGIEYIPATANIGYDEPRDYLPREIIELLDQHIPSGGVA